MVSSFLVSDHSPRAADPGSPSSDLLQPLHFVHARDLPQTDDDLLEMFQVRNIEDNLNARLAIRRVRRDVPDIALGVSNHTGDALQHAEPIVAEDRELDWICGRSAVIARPFDFNLPLRFVEEICDIWTADGMHRHALAPRDVADDAFTANRITTSCPVHQHVSLSAHHDGVVIAENPPDDAGDCPGL